MSARHAHILVTLKGFGPRSCCLCLLDSAVHYALSALEGSLSFDNSCLCLMPQILHASSSGLPAAGTQELSHSDSMLDDATADLVDQADRLEQQAHDRQGSPSGSVELENIDAGDYADFEAAKALSLQKQGQPEHKQQLHSLFCKSPEPTVVGSKEEILLSSGTATDRSDDAVQPQKTSKHFSTGHTESHSLRQPEQAGWARAVPQQRHAQPAVCPATLLKSPVKAGSKFLQGVLSHVFSKAQPKSAQVGELILTSGYTNMYIQHL